MDSSGTSITYERVRSDANTISECAKTMDSIFNKFAEEINTATSADNYEGTSSEALKERFNSLKPKFVDYVNLLNQFSSMITGAAQATETTEKAIASDADTLAS